ncbi:hypothetical protein REPUB_Repub01dG0029700 [Reevesia pubescens]
MINTMEKLLILFTVSLCLYLLVALLNVLYKYWWIPSRIQFILNSQGIKGPPYEFIHGNNKETVELKKEALSKPLALTLKYFPEWEELSCLDWSSSSTGYYRTRSGQRGAENSEKAFPKRKPTYFLSKILGDGLATTEREKWQRQRKLANHAFHGESLKNMTPAVVASVETMLEKWKGQEGKEIEVFQEFRLLSSEVISRTGFGSSYLEGEKIFEMLTKLTVIAGRNIYKAKIPFIS